MLDSVMTRYNGLTNPGSFVLYDIHTIYHHTLALDQLLDLSPSGYWKIIWFKFDDTCSQILEIFTDNEPLSGFYNFLDYGLSPFQSHPGNERKEMSLAEPPPGGDDHFFISGSISSELDLLFDCIILEEQLNWLDLESLTNHTHYIYCVSPSTYDPSESNFHTEASCNDSLVGGIRAYINDDLTGLIECLPFLIFRG